MTLPHHLTREIDNALSEMGIEAGVNRTRLHTVIESALSTAQNAVLEQAAGYFDDRAAALRRRLDSHTAYDEGSLLHEIQQAEADAADIRAFKHEHSSNT